MKQTVLSNPSGFALFLMAVLSLLMVGCIVGDNLNLKTVMVIVAGGLCGVGLFYNGNHIVYEFDPKRRTSVSSVNKIKLLFPISLFIFIPLGYFFLSKVSFVLFLIAGILGILYSLPIRIKNRYLRLKNIFLIKNLFIGFSWGLLILIGAGELDNNLIIQLFFLAFIQVFIGSTIRDISDVSSDTENSVRSIPIVLGVKNTIRLLHLINFSSFLVLLYFDKSVSLIQVLVIIVIWRFINLLMLSRNSFSKFWIQTFNLATCFLYFVVIFIQYYYGII